MAYFLIEGTRTKCVSDNVSLFNYLTDFSNFVHILPEDKTDNFSYDANSCSFQIKGITQMKIIITGKVPYSEIEFASDGLGKFNFQLRVHFFVDDASCSSLINLSGDINPFIKAMAEKPLKELVESMNRKLAQLDLNA